MKRSQRALALLTTLLVLSTSCSKLRDEGFDGVSSSSKAPPYASDTSFESTPPANPFPVPPPGGSGGAPRPSHSRPPDPIVEPPPPEPFPIQDPFAATAAALDALPWGNIVYNPPSKMMLGETRTIELLLSPKVSIDSLKDQIQAAGEKEGARVKISNQMRARLTGNGFTINAITNEQQLVGSQPTCWKWDVVAVAKGAQQLHLTLTVVVTVNGEGGERNLDTFDKTILVEVTPWQMVVKFASSNWQWLWAVMLTPLVGWLWRRRSSKRQVSRS